MGDYTQYHKLYLVDEDELVDVESQLNYNWDRLDDITKKIVEYYPTDVVTIGANFPRVPGQNFFKFSSNSIYSYRPDTTGLWQDSSGDVDPWVNSSSFIGGYRNYDSGIGRVGYKIEPTDDYVYWRGLIKLNNLDDIPRNAHINVMNLPAATIPSNSRYFHVHSGVGSGAVHYRLMFQVSGILQVIRYGPVSQGIPEERYISLTDVAYPIDDGNVP